MIIIRFTSWLLLLALLACTPVCAAEESDSRWQTLTGPMTELARQHRLPGMAALIVEDGKTVWQLEYGFADSDREVPVSVDTPFWIASVTKPFVALTYLHLQAEGKVNLAEPARLTPNFTSLCEWLAGTDIPFAVGLDCEAEITIDHILHHQANFVPGSRFMYNPILYSRLSRHLEYHFGGGVDAVEGRHNQLGRFIDEYVLQPAGMTHTMSSMWDPTKARVYQQMADGFAVDEQGRWTKLRQPDKHIAGGAGIVASVSELARFESALNSGLLTPQPVAEKLYRQPAYDNGEPAPYGYGWYFQTYQGQRLMWHSGWDPEAGYSAIYLRVPDEKLALIILANSGGIWWGNPLDKAQIETSDFARRFLAVALADN